MSIIDTKIGIVGGGQLGKMMILEAKKLGFYVVVLDPSADCPASSICDELITESFDDDYGYFELAQRVDVITYEFEHINVNALEKIERDGTPVYPSVKALKTIQNKYLQKLTLQDNGIPVPRLSKSFTPDLGFPVMFKSSMGGYDGKGNWVIREESDIPAGVDGFFEAFVDFGMEISVIVCRSIKGKVIAYPVAENIHKNSILDTTIVPARINEKIHKNALRTANRVMEVFEGVGIFCVEMFVDKNGNVSVNEVAPRPHNSGHYTIEGCFASQFENHIRAITGLSLGSARFKSPIVMVNLLGESNGKASIEGVERAYYLSKNARIHFYGKSESKIGRKMGHFTVSSANRESAIKRADEIRDIVKVIGIPDDK
jgi:5-(carboxyamino)imidazole ribonucleotide synthase